MCNPGLSLDDYFAEAKPWERPIFDVVHAHIETLGDVIVDPIDIGILFKNPSMFCELRAKTKWTAVGFHLRRKLTSAKLSRKVVEHSGKYFHVVNITDPEDIDEEILEWLSESYLGETKPAGRASMVPDDLDDADLIN